MQWCMWQQMRCTATSSVHGFDIINTLAGRQAGRIQGTNNNREPRARREMAGEISILFAKVKIIISIVTSCSWHE